MDNTSRINDILLKLRNGDTVTRNNACDDAFLLISELEDKTEQDRLRQEIVLYLIDLGRDKEAQAIIQALHNSDEQNIKIAAYFDQIEYCKKIDRDPSKVEQAIRECLAFTQKNGNKAAEVDAVMEMGKCLSIKSEVRDALTNFSNVSLFAEDNNNRRLLAVSKYYIGYCLYHLGHLVLAESYLREATELAYQEQSALLAKHIEVLRAIVFLKQGQAKESYAVLKQWENNFALSL